MDKQKRTSTNKGIDRQRMMSQEDKLTEIVDALKAFHWVGQ